MIVTEGVMIASEGVMIVIEMRMLMVKELTLRVMSHQIQIHCFLNNFLIFCLQIFFLELMDSEQEAFNKEELQVTSESPGCSLITAFRLLLDKLRLNSSS